MKTIYIFIAIISVYLLNIVFGECYQDYCWEDDNMMLIAAEKEFRKQMEQWEHDHDLKKSNLCQYHLSSIAYWFAIVESSMWDSKVSDKTNNRFSMRQWSGKYQYQRQSERGKLKWSRYMKYPTPFLSAMDFMYLYKYAYYCKLSMVNISMYKVWNKKWDANTQRYYNSLLSSIKYFEKKFFWNGQTLDDYDTSRKTDKLHGSAEIQLSKVNFSTNQTKSITTIKTSTPKINFSTNQIVENKKIAISGSIDLKKKYKLLNKIFGGEIKTQNQWNKIILIGKSGKKYSFLKSSVLEWEEKVSSNSKLIDLSNAKVFSNQSNTGDSQKAILINKVEEDAYASKALNMGKSDDFLNDLKEENIDTTNTTTTDTAQQEIYKNKLKKDLQKMDLNYDTFMNLVKDSVKTWNNQWLFESRVDIFGS